MSAARRDPKTEIRFTKGQINRAGELMVNLRETMDRLGPERALQQFDDDELETAWQTLTWWRTLHARPLSTVAANLRYHVDKEEGRIGGHIEVTQRLKRLNTMIRKLTREQGRITQMHDIGGVRAVLPSLRHVHAVSRRLRKSWTIVRVRDYIAKPKDTGYRALHLIVQRKGYAIEVQLRTIAQDLWANQVEEVGREVGMGLKFGAGDPRLYAFFAARSETLARFDRGELPPEELAKALKTMPSSKQSRNQERPDEPR